VDEGLIRYHTDIGVDMANQEGEPTLARLRGHKLDRAIGSRSKLYLPPKVTQVITSGTETHT
jgi:hypothetical protein